MKWILIGHRGVGKTSLLKRMRSYFPEKDLNFFDLDQEVSIKSGKSVSDIFQNLGEAHFREIEKQTFVDLVNDNDKFILSVGAGFQLKNIPDDCQVLWVRRKTDSLGRVFFNRPRLNKNLSALDEYFERYPVREDSYAAHSDFQYLMPEGIEKPHFNEEMTLKLLMGEKSDPAIGGILTLLPHHLKQEVISRLLSMSVDYFELRDDLLSIEEIESLISRIPLEKILLSFRKNETSPKLIEMTKKNLNWDWALELGDCPFGKAPIISCHRLSLQELKAKKFSATTQLKYSPEIKNFQEIQEIFQWQKEDPDHRSILPRSPQDQAGRWTWMRLWLKGKQKLNFLRIDAGSASDQPSLYEWIGQKKLIKEFSAVIGHPVFHSRTPIEQQEFFNQRNFPVYAIDLDEDEFHDAFQFLDELGLRAAAVTSPLKKLAADLSEKKSELVQKCSSANTLYKDQVWQSENTDFDGFEKLIRENLDSSSASIAVWGGGGTLPVIQQVLPKAVTYSVRSGEIRDANIDSQEFIKQKLEGPEVLIWAAGPDAQPPMSDWKPAKVIDLNYREDSLAREYAVEVNAEYVDGLLMFQKQAEKQREFWSQFK